MKRQEAVTIVTELKIMGYDAHLLESGTRHRQYSVLLTDFGSFYRREDYLAWKERIERKESKHDD